MFLPSLTLTECIVQRLIAKVASNGRVPLFSYFLLLFSNLFVAVIRVVEMFIEHLDCPGLNTPTFR